MSLHLSVDGDVLRPIGTSLRQISFRLRLPAQEIRLLSGAARPADRGINDDTRWLGVRIAGLRLQKGTAVAELPLSVGEFHDGFHSLEEERYRWTNGDALLPNVLLPAWTGEVLLHVAVANWFGADAPPCAEDQDAGALLNSFESLGRDCEFAFVQRHYRATLPAGLLTWSAISYPALLQGLDNGFSDLEDAAATTLLWNRNEYKLRTRTFQTHTGYKRQVDATEEAAIQRNVAARLRLQRRRLLADLGAGKRIFVWKGVEDEGDPLALHRALRRFGPVPLLWVTKTGAGQAGGTVEPIAQDVYWGRLTRFVMGRGPYDEWLTICRRTHSLHQAEPASTRFIGS